MILPPGYNDTSWPYAEIIQRHFPESGTLLEVGCFCGLSTVEWAVRLPNFSIHSVDIHDEPRQTHDGRWVSPEEQVQYLHKVVDNHPNVSYTHGDFFAKEYETPDVFFYDGDHDFDPCLEALNRMKDAPVIVVDDYSIAETGRAIDLFVRLTGKQKDMYNTQYFSVAVLT